jgi:hypothetical protein
MDPVIGMSWLVHGRALSTRRRTAAADSSRLEQHWERVSGSAAIRELSTSRAVASCRNRAWVIDSHNLFIRPRPFSHSLKKTKGTTHSANNYTHAYFARSIAARTVSLRNVKIIRALSHWNRLFPISCGSITIQ